MPHNAVGWEAVQINSGLSPLDFAAEVYRHRNVPKEEREAIKESGKDIRSKYRYQPSGFYTYASAIEGNGKFWYPTPSECRMCCSVMNPPGHQYPFVYQRHCRTIRHIAILFNVSERELARVLGLSPTVNNCANCGKFRPAADYLCKVCRASIAA